MAEHSAKAYAISSFIMGIISFLLGWIPVVGWIFIIVAFILGLIGLRKMKKSNNLTWKGLAIAGIVLSSIAFITALIVGLAVLQNLSDDTINNSTIQEISQTGGTLASWKEKIQQKAGVESEEYKTLTECEELLQQKVNECSTRQGWSVVNVMEVTDFQTEEPYSFQEVTSGGCKRTSPEGKIYPQNTETKTIITQAATGSSYQVACNVVCVWWECTEEDKPAGNKLTPETWTGTIDGEFVDLGASCSDGEVSVSYSLTLNSPVSLFSALKGEQEITLWSDPGYKETSGTIQGTATAVSQPSREGVIYCELEDGESEDVSINFFVTAEQVIQLAEVPGSKTIRTPQFGKEYYYHQEAGLTEEDFLAGFPPLLEVTSMTDTEISGIVKPGYGYEGTFVLRKG